MRDTIIDFMQNIVIITSSIYFAGFNRRKQFNFVKPLYLQKGLKARTPDSLNNALFLLQIKIKKLQNSLVAKLKRFSWFE